MIPIKYIIYRATLNGKLKGYDYHYSAYVYINIFRLIITIGILGILYYIYVYIYNI